MRKWLVGPLMLVVIGCADTVAWRIGIAQLTAGTDRWIADTRRQGWTVTEQKRTFGGWPFSATLAIAAPSISGGAGLVPGGLRWSSQGLILAISVFHPTRLALDAQGQQHVQLSGLPDLVFTGERLAASIKLWGSAQDLVQMEAEAVTGGIAGSRHTDDVQIGSLRVSVARIDAAGPALPSARLDVRAGGIGLPDTIRWPLGARMSTLGGTLRLNSPAPGPVAQAGDKSQMQAWRDGGGRLVAQDVRLHWGPLKLAGAASLTLDDRLQPAGTGSADITGGQATLDALAGAGVLTSGLAATGSAMLAFMPQAPGDAAAIRLPFVLRNNTVSVGQIPVFHVKDVIWK